MGAPKVTEADIEAEIVGEHYFTASEGVYGAETNPFESRPRAHVLGDFPLAKITFCLLVLRNGIVIVGKNHGPVDPASFDSEKGREYARDDAIEQLWPLLGFRLADKLTALAEAERVVAGMED